MASSENKPSTVSDRYLQALAGKLGKEWLDLARNLNISDASLHNITLDNIGNTRESKYQMLISWKQENGPHATYSSLAGALKKSGRMDLSEEVMSGYSLTVENETVALGGIARNVKDEFQLYVPTVHSTQATVCSSQSVVPPSQPAHPPILVKNGKKIQFVEELCHKYNVWCGETQPAPFLHDKYDLDKLFVPTGIGYLEEKHLGQEKWTTLKDYKTIFTDPQVKSKRRIIDGEPGCGKSTLALRIAKDWCDRVTPLDQYDIVILLRLRQFKNVPTVYSAIKRFLLPKDSSLTEDDIKTILDSSSTLVVLDGYDEYPDREKEDTDVHDIIKGDMFQKHEVVVTTRTSCLSPNQTNATIKRLRLTGFDDYSSREKYIQNVVSSDCSDVVDRVNTFLEENPDLDELFKIPLFFTMVSFMVKINEELGKFTTVTQFFRYIIKCFDSHKAIKGTIKGTAKIRIKDEDHSKLDEVAFDGLNGDVQQISWGKKELTNKLGEDLYDEYVSIGILIEEESRDNDNVEYNTETGFFHKLFAEWYAAHYLAKVAAQPETEFEPWPKRRCLPADTRQSHQTPTSDNMQSLKNLNPNDVHYMYRYACGLNPEAAVKIIKHLATNKNYDKYTILCVKEWGGNLETIQDTVSLLCSRIIRFRDTDSILLQKSTEEFITFASTQKIFIDEVRLSNCLSIDSTGNLCVQPSNLTLPAIDTSLCELVIYEIGREMTEEETGSILQYAAKCQELETLLFQRCLVPQYIEETETLSVLRSREVEVQWVSPEYRKYFLNLTSGQWMIDDDFGKPMTDEQYQEAVDQCYKRAKKRQKQTK